MIQMTTKQYIAICFGIAIANHLIGATLWYRLGKIDGTMQEKHRNFMSKIKK